MHQNSCKQIVCVLLRKVIFFLFICWWKANGNICIDYYLDADHYLTLICHETYPTRNTLPWNKENRCLRNKMHLVTKTMKLNIYIDFWACKLLSFFHAGNIIFAQNWNISFKNLIFAKEIHMRLRPSREFWNILIKRVDDGTDCNFNFVSQPVGLFYQRINYFFASIPTAHILQKNDNDVCKISKLYLAFCSRFHDISLFFAFSDFCCVYVYLSICICVWPHLWCPQISHPRQHHHSYTWRRYLIINFAIHLR